nr:MAG: RNA-dependent RNA polymerase [Nanchang Perib tick virus 1]
MPSESLMKGETAVPYIIVTVRLPGDLYCSMGDHNEMVYKMKSGGHVIVTKGRRVNRAQVMGHMDSFPRFQIAKSIMAHLKRESGGGELSRQDMVRLFTFVNRISISSSSLLDNARYMVELCMADLSNVKKYIEGNFMVPIKTRVHAYMYKRLMLMLSKVNQAMQTIKMRLPQVTEEGEVDISSMRIVDGEFPSYLFDHTYRKPDQLLQEVITLFFCTPKALHGKFHNSVNIHKTPLEIQEPLNDVDLPSTCTENVTERCHYNPVVVALATMAAEGTCSGSPEQVRQSYRRMEKPDMNPLSVPTLTSTRSTLIEREGKGLQETVLNDLSEMDGSTLFEGLDPKSKERIQGMITNCAKKVHDPSMRPNTRQKVWRKMKKKVNDIAGNVSNITKFLNHVMSLNAETGQLYMRPIMAKDKSRSKLISLIKEQAKAEAGDVNSEFSHLPEFAGEALENYKFFDSGVVLTEVLQKVLNDRRDGRETTITSMAFDCLKSGDKATFAVRPKGQRTQKDREIFVLDLGSKTCLYLLEHFYKQMCFKMQSEKISLAGDLKVIDMYNQTKVEITWCRQMLEAIAMTHDSEESDLTERENVMCIHFDLDMTKWAPKDNLLKFYWVVAYCQYLRLGEKLFFFKILDRLWNKVMYLDDNLILQSMKNVGTGEADGEGCIFYRSTDGYKRNLVPIQMTWLQGQLNYLSSFLHAGIMKMFEDIIEEELGRENVLVHANVHSDDNETTVCCKTTLTFNEAALKFWNILDFLTKNVCIEMSLKKSYVSRTAKSFISIYNIGGEQIHPWVKPLMTTVSGLPYLTLADDISSAMSKVAEAGSKGAPRHTLEIAINIARRHILDAHGVLDKKDNCNLFSKKLGIPEELLPTTLGGMHVRDMTSLIIGGPKVIDKMNLMMLMRNLTGALSDRSPSKEVSYKNLETAAKPPLRNITKGEVLKALQLIVLSDLLCYETMDSEESNTHCKGLNFLRPAKFLMRRSGGTNPFKTGTVAELKEEAEAIKKQYPQIMVQKPLSIEDLLNYYKCQYADTKFQDSLAGQSPAMLKLSMIQQRHKPRYRLLHTGKVGEGEVVEGNPEEQTTGSEEFTEIEVKVINGIPITMDELCIYLNNRMSRIQPRTADCQMLWARYCSNDPEFKCLQFVNENCITGSTFRRQNTIPIKKPDFRRYSDMVNTVASIISTTTSDDYAKRNGFTMSHSSSAGRDWEILEGMFPRECMVLKYRAMCNPGDHQLFLKMMASYEDTVHSPKKLADYRANLTKPLSPLEEEDMLVALRIKKKVMKEKERLKHWESLDFQNDYESPRDFVDAILETGAPAPEWSRMTEKQIEACKTLNETLSKDLIRMTRTFKMETGKVIFCPPTAVADLISVTLQLRSVVESSPSKQFTMHLSRQLTPRRDQAILEKEVGTVRWCEYAARAVSLLYEIMRCLGFSSHEMTIVLKSTNYAGKPVASMTDHITKLSRTDLQRLLAPTALMAQEYVPLLLRQACPHTKVWLIAQKTHGQGAFTCKIMGNGFRMIAVGSGRSIVDVRIEANKKRIPVEEINMALQDLARDIYFGGRKAFHGEVHLSKVFTVKGIPDDTPEDRLVLGHGNRLVLNRNGKGVGLLEAIKLSDKGDSLSQREIDYKELLPNLFGVVVEEERTRSEVPHKYDLEADMSSIEVIEPGRAPLDINKVIAKVNYRAVIARRWHQVSLESLIKCMRRPGTYTGLAGSLHCKFAMKLVDPGYGDRWLDTKSNGTPMMLKVRQHLEALMVYHQMVSDPERDTNVQRDLEDIKALEAALITMSDNPVMMETAGKKLQEMLNDKKQVVKMKTSRPSAPEKDYDIPEEVVRNTISTLMKLERWADIESTQKMAPETVRDVLIGSYPSGRMDFVVQSSSIVSTIQQAATGQRSKPRVVPRRKRPQTQLAEVIRNADIAALNEDEAVIMARGLGMFLSMTRAEPSLAAEAVNIAISDISEDTNAVKLVLETALAKLDSDVYYSIPCVQGTKGYFPAGVRVETERECSAMIRAKICQSNTISNPVKLFGMLSIGSSDLLRQHLTGTEPADYVGAMLAMSKGKKRGTLVQKKKQVPPSKSGRLLKRAGAAVQKATFYGLKGTDAVDAGLSDARADEYTTGTEVSDADVPLTVQVVQSTSGFPKEASTSRRLEPESPPDKVMEEYRFEDVGVAMLADMSDSDTSDED